MPFFKLQIVFIILFLSGCGKMPAGYNQATLACGDLDKELFDSASGLFKVVSSTGSVDPNTLEAQWISKKPPYPLSVSKKGCILTPKDDGSLKILGSDRREGLLLNTPKGELSEPIPLQLRPLTTPIFNIRCEKSLVKQMSDIGLVPQWENIGSQDIWQIESLHLIIQEQGESLPQKIALLNQDFITNQPYRLAPMQVKDGLYSLRLEVLTIAGDSLSSDSSCNFTLDASPPQARSLLATTLSDGDGPLQLSGLNGQESVFYCIGTGEKLDCLDLDRYQRASELLLAPTSGSYVLHSFSEDAAGNRSTPIQEKFFRDLTPPKLGLEWLTPQLKAGYDWSLALGATYRFKVTAQDDSADFGYMTGAELDQNLECKVTIVDPTGARRPGSEASCSEGQCQGKTLDSWIPCSGVTGFRFDSQSEFSLFASQIILEARGRDLVNRIGTIQSSFWMNPNAMENWSNDTQFKLPGSLEFVNDRKGRFLAFTDQLNREGIAEKSALFVRQLGSEAWSSPMPIKTSFSINLFPHQKMTITPSFDPLKKTESLWLFANQWEGPAIAEIPLEIDEGNSLPCQRCGIKNLNAIRHAIPEALVEDYGNELPIVIGVTDFVDANQKQQLALLLVAADNRDHYALVAFDGKTFRMMGQAQDSEIPMKVGEMVLSGPGESLILLLDGRIAIFDPAKKGVFFPKIRSNSEELIHSLYHDKLGYYGLTKTLNLFTFSFESDGQTALLDVFKDSEKPAEAENLLRIERRSDGSFWMSAYSSALDSVFLSLRPGIDSGWQSQDSLWGWTVSRGSISHPGFGIDQTLDQVVLASPNVPALRKTLSCNFIEVTDQGVFRSDVARNPTEYVKVSQDANGNLWRSQILGNRHMILSRLDDAQRSKSVNMVNRQDTTPMLSQSLIMDHWGSAWVQNLAGELSQYDKDQNAFVTRFNLGEAWNSSFFDQQGNYWGLYDGKIKVRRVAGTIQSLTLPAPWSPSGFILKQGGAWVIGRSLLKSQLFELNFAEPSIRNDIQLTSDSHTFIAINEFNGRRLAAVGDELFSDPSGIVSQLQNLSIQEFNGREWVPWDQSLQPRFPPWHHKAGQLIQVPAFASGRLFFESETNVLWLSTVEPGGRPVLARFINGGWQFFKTSTEHIKGVVQDFWKDTKGRLVLSTADKIFYYNPQCVGSAK